MYIEWRDDVRWFPGQEASLVPPFSNLRSFGNKCTILTKVLVILLRLFGAPCSDSTPAELFPPFLPLFYPACTTKHKIYNKTPQKHQYNRIPIFRSIVFLRDYTDAHLCFIKYIESCEWNSKIFAIFFAPCMVIDSPLKKFAMNTQLRQYFSRANIFRLKKGFVQLFCFSKKPSALKNPEFRHLASNTTNLQPEFLYQWSRNFMCRLELAAAVPWLLRPIHLRPFIWDHSFKTTFFWHLFVWDLFIWEHIHLRSRSFYATSKWSCFDLLCASFLWSTFHFFAGGLKFRKVTLHFKFCKVTPFCVQGDSRWVVNALVL